MHLVRPPIFARWQARALVSCAALGGIAGTTAGLAAIRPRARGDRAASTVNFVWLTRLGRAVPEVDDLRPEGPRLDELETDPVLEGREERRAGAEDHRVDEEAVVVDEAVLDQGGGEAGAADGQRIAGLLLQAGDDLDGVAGGQGRVALDRLERRREHELGRRLPDAGELELYLVELRVLLGGQPEAHDLVELAAVQLEADPAYPLVVERVQLRVGRGPVDVVAGRGD